MRENYFYFAALFWSVVSGKMFKILLLKFGKWASICLILEKLASELEKIERKLRDEKRICLHSYQQYISKELPEA